MWCVRILLSCQRARNVLFCLFCCCRKCLYLILRKFSRFIFFLYLLSRFSSVIPFLYSTLIFFRLCQVTALLYWCISNRFRNVQYILFNNLMHTQYDLEFILPHIQTDAHLYTAHTYIHTYIYLVDMNDFTYSPPLRHPCLDFHIRNMWTQRYKISTMI